MEFKEFVELMTARTGYTEDQDELRRAFDVLDTDKDGGLRMFLKYLAGLLTAEQVREAMSPFGMELNPEELESIFGSAKTDENGRFNFEEFSKIMVS